MDCHHDKQAIAQDGVVDIIQRVFGAESQVDILTSSPAYWIVVGIKARDPLTQSQQEMDAILSLQHLLGAQEIKLEIRHG